MRNLDNAIVLQDEDGESVVFEFLDFIESDGAEYVVLLPTEDEGKNQHEVVILQIEESGDDETESYLSVDDEATLMRVFSLFKDRFKDVYDFVD